MAYEPIKWYHPEQPIRRHQPTRPLAYVNTVPSRFNSPPSADQQIQVYRPNDAKKIPVIYGPAKNIYLPQRAPQLVPEAN